MGFRLVNKRMGRRMAAAAGITTTTGIRNATMPMKRRNDPTITGIKRGAIPPNRRKRRGPINAITIEERPEDPLQVVQLHNAIRVEGTDPNLNEGHPEANHHEAKRNEGRIKNPIMDGAKIKPGDPNQIPNQITRVPDIGPALPVNPVNRKLLHHGMERLVKKAMI